jgi:hypothetical protein
MVLGVSPPVEKRDFLDMLFDFVGYFGAIVIVGVVKLFWRGKEQKKPACFVQRN